MAALNLTLDLPYEYETKSINVTALKADLVAFAKILLASPSIVVPVDSHSTGSGQASSPTTIKTTDADPFAELDTTWGGDRDANEIADELHAMRADTRTIEAW